MTDKDYMALAWKEAQKGMGWVNPNPMVGAVVVKQGRIIGLGHHEKFGGLHAERNALAACTEDPKGATLYVTLEPCCHWGKTPPCTEVILERGLSRVVVGSPDPNPLVAGKGNQILRDHGVEVTEGVLQEECDELNRVFFHYITHQTPYVILKYAMTLDGKIATRTGASQWITGELARQRVHEDRHRCAAIMVGVGTVLADDPRLTCRLPGCKSPIRVIVDSRLDTPLTAHVVTTAKEVPTILATCETDSTRQKPFRTAGCQVWVFPAEDGHMNLKELMKRLGQEGVDSILLEGGGTMNWSALEAGVVQEVHAYIAPKFFGGSQAVTPISGLGVETPDDAVRLSPPVITWLGDDILLESKVLGCSQES